MGQFGSAFPVASSAIANALAFTARGDFFLAGRFCMVEASADVEKPVKTAAVSPSTIAAWSASRMPQPKTEFAMLRSIVATAVVGLGLVGFMAIAGEKSGVPLEPGSIRFEPAKTEKGEMIKVTTDAITFLVPSMRIQGSRGLSGEIKAENGFIQGADDSDGNTWRSSQLTLYPRPGRQVPAAPPDTHKNSN